MANRAKYSFVCGAPEQLTQYNKEYNKQIEDECFVTPKFQPCLLCLDKAPGQLIEGSPQCKYLKVKKLK